MRRFGETDVALHALAEQAGYGKVLDGRPSQSCYTGCLSTHLFVQ
jgi:hypothetical protein